jgi:nickel-dependent lactate racemase
MLLDTGKEQLPLVIPEGISVEIVCPPVVRAVSDAADEIARALDEPIGAPRLEEIARRGKTAAVMVCDNTRYVPLPVILPLVLERLNAAGIADANITIVIACGLHAPMREDAVRQMLGDEVFHRAAAINHDARNPEKLTYFGESEILRAPVYLNQTVAEADIRVGIGTVDPHIFAGYSGGVKILSVGCAGEKTIAATHNARVMEDEDTKFGDIRHNTFRLLLDETERYCPIHFLINVVQDDHKRLIGAFCGDAHIAYEEAVNRAKTVFETYCEGNADVCITLPHYPKTRNLYQAIRAVNSVLLLKTPLVKTGGLVIVPASCEEGTGSDSFYREIRDGGTPEQIIQHGREFGFDPEDNKTFTVARMLQRARVMLTDTKLPEVVVQDMGFGYAKTVSDALYEEWRKKPNLKLCILTDGFLTLPSVRA